MKIHAFGSKVIVERLSKEENDGFILVSETPFVMGKVVSVESILLQEGSLVIYPTAKANPIGLGFPSTYEAVETEDIIGVVQEEKNDE